MFYTRGRALILSHFTKSNQITDFCYFLTSFWSGKNSLACICIMYVNIYTYRIVKFLDITIVYFIISIISILYFEKSQLRSKMENCWHIWTGGAQPSLSSCDKLLSLPQWLEYRAVTIVISLWFNLGSQIKSKHLCSFVGDYLFSTIQPLSQWCWLFGWFYSVAYHHLYGLFNAKIKTF